MSVFSPTEGLPYPHRRLYEVGLKMASAQTPAYDLAGMFHVAEHEDQTWGLVTVPNALVRGVYAAMDAPGAELPPTNDGGRLNAHITVLRPDEIVQIGGADKLKPDRGKQFNYTLGRLVTFRPAGWPGMERAWAVRVHSPDLQRLRRSYGLSSLPNEGKYDFHVTVAVRRSGVLGRNERRKSD